MWSSWFWSPSWRAIAPGAVRRRQHRTILATKVYEGTTMRGESELESEVRKRVIQARCISTISMAETFMGPSSVSISSVDIRISFFAIP